MYELRKKLAIHPLKLTSIMANHPSFVSITEEFFEMQWTTPMETLNMRERKIKWNQNTNPKLINHKNREHVIFILELSSWMIQHCQQQAQLTKKQL